MTLKRFEVHNNTELKAPAFYETDPEPYLKDKDEVELVLKGCDFQQATKYWCGESPQARFLDEDGNPVELEGFDGPHFTISVNDLADLGWESRIGAGKIWVELL